MHNGVIAWQVDCLGVFNDILNIGVGDFAIGRDDRMHAGVVEAPHVAAAHAEKNGTNLDIRHVLGLDDCVPHVLLNQ